MKSQFKNTPIALAVAAMFLSPIAFADDNNDGGRDRDAVSIKKDLSLEQDLEIKGHVYVGGFAYVDSSSIAIVNDAQKNEGNHVSNGNAANSDTPENGGSSNTSSITNNALSSASGNIGLNVGAGDNNQQANAAAFSAADASFVFGSSDAEVFASQSAKHNTTDNYGHTNTATLNGNALNSASGNIGVNIASGTSNQQKNDLAASVAVARIATATVGLSQENSGNNTVNLPVHREEVQNRPVNLALSAGGGYLGFGNGGYNGTTSSSYSGTTSATTTGTSDQIGNVYPDIWSGTPQNGGAGDHVVHPGGSPVGHFDLDTQTQGGSDLNNDGGALAFNNSGSSTGSESGTSTGNEHGTLGFVEAGGILLSGAVTGNIPVVVAVNLNTTNTSLLGDNALQSASGNIGVNIATGSNNQQFNGLAISATQAGTGTGGGSGTPGGGETLR